MKVSELIEELKRFLDEHGDADVVAYDNGEESNSFVNIVNYSRNPSKDYYFKGDSVTDNKSCVLECYGCKLVTLKDRLKMIEDDGIRLEENIECDISLSLKNKEFKKMKCKLKELIGTKYENYLTDWFRFDNNSISTWLIEK